MIRKIRTHYTTTSFPDFCRKVIYNLKRTFSVSVFRKIKSYYYFKNSFITLGRRVSIHGLPLKVRVGDRTSIYDHCIFEFDNASDVRIGSNVVFSYGVLLSCRKKIHIGDDVQIGEYTSIRDATHRHDELSKPMKYASDITEAIVIKDNVWIGRGCLISPGSFIESGVVVAANSVVKGRLEGNAIYGGIPAKLIKYREQVHC
jgi:acetyltransferase-like isoleucine patch superfamily enzyme